MGDHGGAGADLLARPAPRERRGRSAAKPAGDRRGGDGRPDSRHRGSGPLACTSLFSARSFCSSSSPTSRAYCRASRRQPHISRRRRRWRSSSSSRCISTASVGVACAPTRPATSSRTRPAAAQPALGADALVLADDTPLGNMMSHAFVIAIVLFLAGLFVPSLLCFSA